VKVARLVVRLPARGFDSLAYAHTGVEIAVDESQQRTVGATAFEPRHQPVVIDAIKERLQVHVHHPAITLPDARLHFAYRLVRRALRPEAVAAWVKMGFPLL
jgi:hypothetical protein